MKIGYACINMTLQTAGGITTNRSMRQKTFNERGLSYASELALQNVKDLVHIIKWNNEMGIKQFRMSSDIFPWMAYYQLDELPDYEEISDYLYMAGDEASGKQRLTFHPGHFNVLGSPNPTVVNKTIKELNQHSEIMNIMGLSRSHYNKINIHIGGTYGDKQATLDRWINNYHKLCFSTQERLTVENDDKASMYSVKELYEGIYKKISVPIVFDFYHHKFCTGGLTEQEALELALSTWPKDITPCTHYSESRRKEKLDEKHKELAVINYNEKHVYERV
jgi:UV DNA damage endonuclease